MKSGNERKLMEGENRKMERRRKQKKFICLNVHTEDDEHPFTRMKGYINIQIWLCVKCYECVCVSVHLSLSLNLHYIYSSFSCFSSSFRCSGEVASAARPDEILGKSSAFPASSPQKSLLPSTHKSKTSVT